MRIRICNKEQKSITIDGKRYKLSGLRKLYTTLPQNASGNACLLDGQIELAIHGSGDSALIRDVMGTEVIITA